MIDKPGVLEIVKQKGMVIPRDIMKELGGDTFLIGAVLSQLKDSKQIKVSNTKIGGSPVYYVPGQESKLQSLYDHLHSKEKQAYDLIKEKRILEDSGLDPSIRVAMRQIRDFAKPVEVNIREKKILFWKWYLTPNNEIETKIREILKHEIKKEEPPQVPQKEIEKKEVKKIKEKEEQKIIEKKEFPSTPIVKKQESNDEFFNKINTYFEKNNIKIIETDIIKKNREIDFIIKIPSSAGELNYFCKAKNKKRCNDADLSQAYVKGENKKLPILFIATGEITKKALNMLEVEFKNITVNKI